MNASCRLVPTQDAYNDLLQRSLAKISCDLGRLIYLASTRDYNNGTYHHDGLAARFHADVASEALATAHRQLFCKLAICSLEELVGQLETYLNSSREGPLEILRIWQKLEPYRVAIPIDANPAAAQLFLSNVRLALAIWRFRHQEVPAPQSAA
jgi:hypothetical protein